MITMYETFREIYTIPVGFFVSVILSMSLVAIVIGLIRKTGLGE